MRVHYLKFDELVCNISMHGGRPMILKNAFFSSHPVKLSYAFFMPYILGLILMICDSYMIMTSLVQSLITLCILLHIVKSLYIKSKNYEWGQCHKSPTV